MKLTASAFLGGLLVAAGLSVAQAQTAATPSTPATPATPATPHGKSMADQTMGTDHMMDKREAEAAYADAKRHCKTMSGQERASCLQRARDDHAQWKDMRKGERDHPKASRDMPSSGSR